MTSEILFLAAFIVGVVGGFLIRKKLFKDQSPQLKNEISKRDLTIVDLNEQIDEINQQKNNLKQDIAVSQSKLDQFTSANADQLAKIESQAAELETVKVENSRIKTQIEEYLNDIEKLNQEDNQNKIKISEYSKENETIRIENSSLKTKLEENIKYIEEQKKIITNAQSELSNTFKALSADALKSNNEEFMKIARANIEKVLESTKSEFGKQAVEETLKPLKDSLKRYDEQIKAMENERQKAYGSLTKQLEYIAENNKELRSETNALVSALSRPEVRGRWGEISLRRVVELVGMNEYCDFEEQVSINTETGRLRPDMIVHLPGEIDIVVDSKAPLKNYLDANEATDEKARQHAMAMHTKAVREHMKKLASKAYWAQFEHSPEFVVMFLPGESFFAAALELDRNLLEDGFKLKVVIATPATLISLMKTVAMSWQQQTLSENARKIATQGEELYTRFIRFNELYGKVGKNLETTVKAWNQSIGSYNARLLTGAEKLRELGSYPQKEELKLVGEIETAVRETEQ